MKIIITVLIAVFIARVLNIGIERQMVHECLTLKEYSETIPGFYYTPQQQTQCEKY